MQGYRIGMKRNTQQRQVGEGCHCKGIPKARVGSCQNGVGCPSRVS